MSSENDVRMVKLFSDLLLEINTIEASNTDGDFCIRLSLNGLNYLSLTVKCFDKCLRRVINARSSTGGPFYCTSTRDQVNYNKSPLLKPELSKGQLVSFLIQKPNFPLHLILT